MNDFTPCSGAKEWQIGNVYTGRGSRISQAVEHRYEPALAAIRDHPFVQGVEQGTVPLVIVRQFAHAEYWCMRGGVKHFALSIMAAPDLETQRFYHQRLSGELEYLERFTH